jgi:hypothetical protein
LVEPQWHNLPWLDRRPRAAAAAACRTGALAAAAQPLDADRYHDQSECDDLLQ